MSYYVFFNSNLFQTIVTAIVGSVAFYLYKKQRSDYKKDAANSIILEIQNAERVIARVKERVRLESLDIDLSILQSNSWNKYKSLFSRDFDGDEWDQIENFYNKSRLLDEAISFNRSSFDKDVEQIRTNRQRVLADLAIDIIKQTSSGSNDGEILLKSFDDQAQLFDKTYMSKQGEFAYKPQKPLSDAKMYLEDLPSIGTSSAGTRLKILAGIRKK